MSKNLELNCLGFALGLEAIESRTSGIFDLNFHVGLVEAVKAKCEEFQIEVRQISSVEEAETDEEVIQVYGFFDVEVGREFDLDSYRYIPIYEKRDFHVIKRTLNGKWVHKKNWDLPPEEVNWVEFLEKYPELPQIFARRRPQ